MAMVLFMSSCENKIEANIFHTKTSFIWNLMQDLLQKKKISHENQFQMGNGRMTCEKYDLQQKQQTITVPNIIKKC